MSDFDWCFEQAFCNNRQMVIDHKAHLGADVWHVCTTDSNGYYHSGLYKLDRRDWTFKSHQPEKSFGSPLIIPEGGEEDTCWVCDSFGNCSPRLTHTYKKGCLCAKDV